MLCPLSGSYRDDFVRFGILPLPRHLDPSVCLTLGFETVVGGLYEIDTIVAYLIRRLAFGADL